MDKMRKREKETLLGEIDMWKSKCERESEREKKKAEEKVEEANRKKDVEILKLKETIKIEQEEWKEWMNRKLQEDNAETIRRMREEMTNKRNKDISDIIDKLGNETHAT